ncbi:MAG: hypothetical protein ABIT36_13435, partial [Steroidobacteraceae bacterium]
MLRFAHSAAQLRLGVPVWRSPQILTWTTWLERELRAATLESPALRGHSILSAPQERVLWQHATLTADGTLAMAQRVQRSATLARDYRLELPLRSQDGAMLRVAVAAFEAACRERRRVSVGLASDAHLRLIAERMAEPVWLAGFVRFTPQQQWFIELLAATGTHCRSVAHASVGTAHIRIAAVPDFATELALVAQWSRRLLEEDPQRRLLVVTPELERDRPALQRAFAATLAPRESTTGLVSRQARQLCSALRFDRGPPLAQRPAIQQALLALTVQPNAAEMTQLTALLHAPFLGTIAEERAKLDVWLRDTGRAQFENDELEQVLVNVPVELATAGSWLLQGLRLQRELLSPPRLTLRGWAERFGAVVDGYGWPGAGATQASGVIAQWRETLGELAGLDAVTGPERQDENSRDSALALLQELLRAGELPVNGDDAPISIAERSDLTERRQGPVVTYDGIWVLGMDASRWPQAARPDPLLPVAAQRQTGMPHASVSGRMMQARAGLAAWLDAGTQVVLSWASAQGEVRQQASPLLDSYAGAEAYESTEVEPSLAQRLATGQALERIGDEQGVPWSGNAPLPGGVKVLEEQGECAFRAYARLRLGAEPLPESAAGMDPRLRGSLLHHCLELLWAELRDSAGLARRTDAQLRQSILAAFDRALADSLQRLVLLPDVRVLARERN